MSIISVINRRAVKWTAVAILFVYAVFVTYRGVAFAGSYYREASNNIKLDRQLSAAQDARANALSKAAHLEFIQARHEDEVAKYKEAAYVAEQEAEKWKDAYVKASSHDLELEVLRKEHASMQVDNAELRRSYDNAVDEVAALLTDKDDLTIKLADQEAVTEQLLYELFFACEDEHTMRRKADMWRDKCLELQHQIEAAAE